jgi:4-amino-4-deoxy-L-arabinose transferase-like glycosyltransferase
MTGNAKSQVPVLVFVLALCTIGVHFLTNLGLFGYGYFRDELYYIVCTEHPALGYVDQPPLSIWILALNRSLFGDSLFSLRLIPAVLSGVIVILAGMIAHELGGRRWSQCIAALAAAVAPVYLVLGSFYSMNVIEMFLWVLGGYLLTRILKGDAVRRWIIFGFLIGLGLLNKHTTAVFYLAVALGLLLSPSRRHLLSAWFWLAGVAAFLTVLPNIIWQIQHGFPSLEFYRNADILKNVPTPHSGLSWGRFLLFIRWRHPSGLRAWPGACSLLGPDRGARWGGDS